MPELTNALASNNIIHQSRNISRENQDISENLSLHLPDPKTIEEQVEGNYNNIDGIIGNSDTKVNIKMMIAAYKAQIVGGGVEPVMDEPFENCDIYQLYMARRMKNAKEANCMKDIILPFYVFPLLIFYFFSDKIFYISLLALYGIQVFDYI